MSETGPSNPQALSANNQADNQPAAGLISSRIETALLWITGLCFLATLLTTWPLWQFRSLDSEPPNIPLLDFLQRLPAAWLILGGLIATIAKPKAGFWILTAAYGIALLADLTRLQPQIFGLLVLLAACIWPAGRKFAFWFLIAMWLWAGIHKLASPYWMGPSAFTILDKMGVGSAKQIHIGFAWFVALTEIALAVVAFLRWRWASILCIAVHLGIVLMLLAMNWNFAVLFWNIAIAAVGSVLLWTIGNEAKRAREDNSYFASLLPKGTFQQVTAAVLLVSPAGFYFGVTPHCLAHALYCDNLPKARITSKENGAYKISTWDSLNAPAPSEHWYFKRYFERVSSIGDKMHILDSRPNLKDAYLYRLSETKCPEISQEEFFNPAIGVGTAEAHDLAPALYQLELANCMMTRVNENAPITSVKFDPETYRPDLLDSLKFLQNLRTVNLSGTDITIRDISKLNRLKNLEMIQLDETDANNEWLAELNGLKRLSLITREGNEITLEGVAETIIRNTRR